MTQMRRRKNVLRILVLIIVLAGVALLYLNPTMLETPFRSSGVASESARPSSPTTTPTVPTASTAYLPFDMPTGPTDRKVFAHYVPWFPISPDNLPADQDYYTTQYMRPNGEFGAHAPYGGYIRDRPLPRPPIRDPNWKYVDVQTDVAQAKSVGIDGFGVDIVNPAAQSSIVTSLLHAAAAARAFAIQLTPDMTGPVAELTEDAFATAFLPFLKHPAAQRLADGRVVLGAFSAEKKPVEWWARVLNTLRKRGVDVAFVPTFLDAHQQMDRFAPISYGFSNWGGRDVVELGADDLDDGATARLIHEAHDTGAIWMQSIPFQDARPRSGAYWESENGVTNRQAWRIASADGAEWVNLITWNDYAETTAMAPSVKHGYGLLDTNAYQLAKFKYGEYPRIERDAVFVVHRTQPFAAKPTYPQTQLMKNVGKAPSRDLVEVQFFSTAAAQGAVRIGTEVHTCDVPAGFTVCTFPLATGDVIATLRRDGADRVVVRSPFPVTASPQVQDLQYVVAGGLR